MVCSLGTSFWAIPQIMLVSRMVSDWKNYAECLNSTTSNNLNITHCSRRLRWQGLQCTLYMYREQKERVECATLQNVLWWPTPQKDAVPAIVKTNEMKTGPPRALCYSNTDFWRSCSTLRIEHTFSAAHVRYCEWESMHSLCRLVA